MRPDPTERPTPSRGRAFWFGLAAAPATGVLLALSFPPYGHGAVAWFALVPLFLGMRTFEDRLDFFHGLAAGAVADAFLLHWFFGIFGPAAAFLIFIKAGFLGAFVTAHNMLFARSRPMVVLAGTPFLWVALESFRCEGWFLEFAWFALGSSQVDVPPILQWASVAGVYGLSWLVCYVNVVLALVLSGRLPLGRTSTRVVLAASVACLAGIAAWGAVRAGETVEVDADLDVVVVQAEEAPGNLAHLTREAREAREARGDGAPWLVVWPEYAFGHDEGDPLTHPRWGEALRDIAPDSGLVFGGCPPIDGPDGFENTAFVLDGAVESVGTYVKHRPIQFFRDGRAGEGSPTFEVGGTEIGIVICYDLDYSRFPRRVVDAGAEVLVVPTMDAAHWGAFARAQHASITALRAVENDRWVVRSASSGVSQIVDPRGRVVAALDGPRPGWLEGRVGARTTRTPYRLFGWRLAHLSWALVIAYALHLCRPRKRRGSAATTAIPRE